MGFYRFEWSPCKWLQSIPIQRLQGFCPSVCFLACESKILCTQLKTRRVGNLVNVEWESTVCGAVLTRSPLTACTYIADVCPCLCLWAGTNFIKPYTSHKGHPELSVSSSYNMCQNSQTNHRGFCIADQRRETAFLLSTFLNHFPRFLPAISPLPLPSSDDDNALNHLYCNLSPAHLKRSQHPSTHRPTATSYK